MKQKILLILTFSFPIFSLAQQVSYNDVAVVVNDSSQTSIDIGNYFAQQRNIPSQNIIHITCTTQEEIDTAQLFDLLSQVRRATIDDHTPPIHLGLRSCCDVLVCSIRRAARQVGDADYCS